MSGIGDELKITNVYHFANGMVVTFDQHGQQMPDFQGPAHEVIPKIRAAGFEGEIPYGLWRASTPSKETMMSASMEMPRYRSHKTVWALKIAAIEFAADGSATIAPADKGYATLITAPGYRERFKSAGDDELGYYVRYADGYESWSPSKVFEEGYTRVI